LITVKNMILSCLLKAKPLLEKKLKFVVIVDIKEYVNYMRTV
jgi:hypothetical protein